MSNKIIFVGDPHLDNRTPLSRLDDYADLTIEKLDTILKAALDNDVETVIFTGDMFDKDNYDQPLSYINKVITAFKKFYDRNIKVYSLIGNHDMKHNKMEYFENSPLNILFQTGYVKHLTFDIMEGFVIHGIDFTQIEKINEINENIDTNVVNILVMHYATDSTIPYESIERKDLQKFDLVVSGHDHNYYPYDINDKPIVLRPGSMIRRTKDDYNLVRTPIAYLVEIKDKQLAIKEIPLSQKTSEQIFKANVFSPTIDYNTGKVSQLFNEQYFKKDTLDLREMVTNLPPTITEETRNKILTYIKEQGL